MSNDIKKHEKPTIDKEAIAKAKKAKEKVIKEQQIIRKDESSN